MNNILKAIDAAYEKASTGVAFWAHEQDREGVTGIVSEDTICQFAYLREEDHAHIPYDDAEANAQLITLLVNHYPELKAEIERLREALKKIESTPLNADLYEGDGGPDDLGQAEWEDGQDYGTMLAADIARTALATPQDDGLDADHLLIDLLFIAGTMDANYRWLEESFNAHLDEPTDIEMMKEARRRFKYWKDLQASIYEQHQIEKMQREKYEKGQTLQDDGLRERVAELIDREYGSFTCSMPNKEARELALEVTDMLLALLPDGAGWRPISEAPKDGTVVMTLNYEAGNDDGESIEYAADVLSVHPTNTGSD